MNRMATEAEVARVSLFLVRCGGRDDHADAQRQCRLDHELANDSVLRRARSSCGSLLDKEPRWGGVSSASFLLVTDSGRGPRAVITQEGDMNSFLAVTLTSSRCRFLGTRWGFLGRRGWPQAQTTRAALTVIALGIAIALTSGKALAQHPAATPTPAPQNPNWCSDVPASPPPPNLEHHPGDWAVLRKRCMNNSSDLLCAPLCQDAKDRWKQQKEGLLNQPSTFTTPTDQPQGPFPLSGGGSGYILPAQPAPAPSGQTSDAADAVSAALAETVIRRTVRTEASNNSG
jgi:hypothetical protein